MACRPYRLSLIVWPVAPRESRITPNLEDKSTLNHGYSLNSADWRDGDDDSNWLNSLIKEYTWLNN